ncbi:MAG TPA: MBL fold metallo-hydrolase [Acidimicrobiia bacterium]|nr:MBL fold metallo-hydrolase [Acidimicrobiia bacterium]
MKLRIWGTRGSLPTPGRATNRYGGNTSCVEVRGADRGHVVVLDAGSGIRALGRALPAKLHRVDVLLTHLHMDHIIGLGFFEALFRPGLEVHIWGPSSTTMPLRDRLARYLSPPLFPVSLRELPCDLELHDVPLGHFALPGMHVLAALVTHPGPTVGYRLDDGRGTLAYLSDHEPALGSRLFPEAPEWTSGFDLAAGVDVLIHDAQYTDAEYPDHVGWGHSSITQAIEFAQATGVGTLVAFHHDPSHDDATLDAIYDDLTSRVLGFELVAAREGARIEVTSRLPA